MRVFNEQAKVTHEAAIGSVNKKQVEILISCGLDESESMDVIVRGDKEYIYRISSKECTIQVSLHFVWGMP